MVTRSGAPRAEATLAFLRQKISSGEWPVNSRIPTEPELMAMIGVSRTTVREAVRSLASLGILETMVSRGTYVRSRVPVSSVLADFITEFGLSDILGMRRAIEVDAAAQAAVHRTPEQLLALRAVTGREEGRDGDYPVSVERGRTPGQFHSLVIEASGNRLVAGVYAGVMAGLRTAAEREDLVRGASPEVRHADHAAILEAIAEQDPTRAAAVMALHTARDLVLPGSTGCAPGGPA